MKIYIYIRKNIYIYKKKIEITKEIIIKTKNIIFYRNKKKLKLRNILYEYNFSSTLLSIEFDISLYIDMYDSVSQYSPG